VGAQLDAVDVLTAAEADGERQAASPDAQEKRMRAQEKMMRAQDTAERSQDRRSCARFS
jgi:hypothetical protein